MFDQETKILVVDDMESMRKIIIAGLKKMGYRYFVEANDGTSAWMYLEQSIGKKGFGLVISDWNMPKMSGFDLLKKIRAHKMLSETPFLMVTAESEQKAVLEAVKEKVSNYIVKPFSPDLLEEKIRLVYKKHFG